MRDYRVYILGYETIITRGSRPRVCFYGPASGAAWPVACRLARLLKATIRRGTSPILCSAVDVEYMAAYPAGRV